MGEIYFKDVPRIGDLFLEEVLGWEEGVPSLLTCLDSDGNRYICQRDKKARNWLIGRTKVEDLLTLFAIPLFDAFDPDFRPFFLFPGSKRTGSASRIAF